jgi:tRNA-specific 2-thiouridylase
MDRRERVVAAMSGGVDSSVAAALLVRQGFDVVGVTLRLNECTEGGGDRTCCGLDAEAEARDVADRLGIPHRVIDGRESFLAEVLAPAWAEYAAGRTPSPCVACNQRLKLGRLLDLARGLGATSVATGHYARVVARPGGGTALLRGVDRNKDQSYFLFALSDAQRAAFRTPLGDRDKPAVRALARELGLGNACRAESQDACFGGDAGFAESLRQRMFAPAVPGRLLAADGTVLGTHAGVHRFTIGQRRGVGVAAGRRAWVVAIDAGSGDVTLSCDPRALDAAGLLATGAVWHEPPSARAVHVQIRHRQAPVGARLEPTGPGAFSIRFDAPVRAVTPGQAVVAWDGDRVVCGGWIDRALPA